MTFITCLWLSLNLFITSLLIHSLFTLRSWLVHELFITCSLLVQYLFITYSQLLHTKSILRALADFVCAWIMIVISRTVSMLVCCWQKFYKLKINVFSLEEIKPWIWQLTDRCIYKGKDQTIFQPEFVSVVKLSFKFNFNFNLVGSLIPNCSHPQLPTNPPVKVYFPTSTSTPT